MHLHVFDAESQVHGELQMQVPGETVVLQTEFVMFLSHAVTGVAACGSPKANLEIYIQILLEFIIL